MKELKTSKGEFLAVKVPDNTYDFIRIEDWANGFILHCSPKLIGVPKVNIKLPKTDKKYSIIGLLSEITAEKAKEIVDEVQDWECYMYHDYCNKEVFTSYFTLKSALDSFKSLMQANEIYSVNPLGKTERKLGLDSLTDDMLCDEQNYNWRKAQEDTGNWLILKKL